ncbi:MAG: 30S ribosomal protein S9, partial [Candidatus Nanoarchaeia archaeon]
MAKLVHVSGKRKTAVARATAKPGHGNIRINSKLLQLYEPEFYRLRLQEPLLIAGPKAAEVDINVTVVGGGKAAQAEAARLAIAK